MSSACPNALTRMRPVRSMTTRLGVPLSWYRPHRDGHGDAWLVGVDADRELNAVLVQERLERHRGHGVVVFEHRVESEHCEIAAEYLLDALRLRQPVRDAARAEHLKRLDHHDLAPETGQGWAVVGIEPAGDGQFRSGGVLRRLCGQLGLRFLARSAMWG